MPVTTPLPDTEAVNASLLLHTPPVVVELSVVVEPRHIVGVPVIAFGNALTVTTIVLLQPTPAENVILAVPAAAPVTRPVEVTLAMVEALELQVPAEVSLRLVVDPIHTVGVPVIAAGNEFIVTVVEIEQPVFIA